jgi:hypothetical protein
MGKLSELFVKLMLDNKQYNSELKKSKKKTSLFGKDIKKIGGLVAGAFAARKIISFGRELIELGGVAEGVRTAFERIAPAGTMEDLQRATAGTVSELELMKRAVSAKNLGLPVENLASLFEFATKRAQETGESVDFLVNSIVTGIGRKSPLILDNLGISAIQLNQKLDGVSMGAASVAQVAEAVGKVAAESMAESGGIIDTNAIKMRKLTAEWNNWKEEIASSDKFLNFIKGSLDDIMATGTIFTADEISSWRKLQAVLFDSREEYLKLAESIEETRKKESEISKQIDEDSQEYRNRIAAEQDLNEEQVTRIKTIGDLRKETDALKDSIELYNVEQGVELQKTLAQIDANEKLIKSLTTLRAARVEAPAAMETRGEVPLISAADQINLAPTLGNMEAFYKRMDEQLKNFTADYWSEYDMFLDGLNEMTEAGVEDLVATFAEGLGRLAAGDIGLEQFFNTVLGSIGSFLGQMGKMLIAYGIGMEAFKKAFTNPIAAIAAGVALVAIGGAISGMASRGPSGLGGGGSAVGGQNFNVITTNAQDQRLVAEVSGNQLNFVLTKYNTNQNRV